MTTVASARTTIFGLVYAAWLANMTSSPIAVLWDNVKGDKPPGNVNGRPVPYARCSIRHTLGEQDTLGVVGARRYLSGGLFTMQIFTPQGDGHALADQLVEIVKDALRTRPPTLPVWFGDISVSEIGQDGPWFNTNVDAVFRYQEVA